MAFDHDIFQHFINCVTDVNIAVRVGRSVMQNIFWRAYPGISHRLVRVLRIPVFQHIRFALGQVAAHREVRFREIQCCLVVGHVLSA